MRVDFNFIGDFLQVKSLFTEFYQKKLHTIKHRDSYLASKKYPRYIVLYFLYNFLKGKYATKL